MENEIPVNGEQMTGTAKWDDILKLCKVEKYNMYRLLPKVTKKHIKPGGQNAMKVILAAQVTGCTVVAAINTLVTAGKGNCTVSLNDT